MSEEEAYLEMPEGNVTVNPDTIWAKISDEGELEVLRWDIVQIYAREYDMLAKAKQQKTQTHTICKLLVLVRDQVRKEYGSAR
jgi:hypothetical protein